VTLTLDHVAMPPTGREEVNALPTSSTAMHQLDERQETSFNTPAFVSAARCHAAAPPRGLVVQSTAPSSSTATQNEEVGHEMD